MTSVMESVNQRTQLVGQNRLEILTFRLASNQRFGINVFKVREVLPTPKLTKVPKLSDMVTGIAEIRGQTMSVIDLNYAIGGPKTVDLENTFVIITEFNSSVQGFLVNAVERISNLNWEEILPPPAGAGKKHHLTSVTHIDDTIVGILDVEKIINDISPAEHHMKQDLVEEIQIAQQASNAAVDKILVVDDSSVARNQISRVLDEVGIEVITAENGKKALEVLVEMSESGNIHDQIALVISDIEMPEMDGYTLTAEIRNNPALKDLYVVLHTSLSGVFNEAMVERVGASDFISKFDADRLGKTVKEALEKARR